jgi:hypothetical protein
MLKAPTINPEAISSIVINNLYNYYSSTDDSRGRYKQSVVSIKHTTELYL